MNRVLFIVLIFWFVNADAQIEGVVLTQDNKPLVGANVYWSDSNIATVTDVNGAFELPMSVLPSRLVAAYVGYIPDTLLISSNQTTTFRLQEASYLEEIVVKDKGDDISISNLKTIKSENIGEKELKKAACCDLAGCFETQISVKPQTTNVLTNAKELRINGLAGVYNQILINGLPLIQGLGFTYGISSIPGTSVQNIFVSKGANSVLQGYESISGQINVITKNPATTDKLLLNLYLNSFGETQANVNFAQSLGDWSTLTTLHTTQAARKIDRDEDTFLDLPQITRYSVSNTWKLRKPEDWGWSNESGIRYVDEERFGGQENFKAATDKGSDEVYGQSVDFKQADVYTKLGYRFNDTHGYTLFLSGFAQQQNSWFGTVNYQGEQLNLYANAEYDYTYQEKQSLKLGMSLRQFYLKENIDFSQNDLNRNYDGEYIKTELIPGFFAENKLSLLNDKATWLFGVRGDWHNQFGFNFTPRSLLKYDFNTRSTMRVNIGTGWRTINLFSENINLLVSSRDIVIADNLEPERAVNFGVNYTHKFSSTNIEGYVTTDFYRTDFQNQIFPDYDSNPQLAIIENFNGRSVSNSFQIDLTMKFWERIEFKAGYNFLDVFRIVNEEKQLLPFNSRHTLVSVLAFSPKSELWRIDLNAHWYGKQRLPSTSSNPIEFQRPDFSEPYTVVNGQFSFDFKKFEFYTGCENLFNFRQNRPILSWQNPFGAYFDTSQVWGPTRGREIYLGVRYRLESK